uniref:CDP-diacylglycerol--inositol 3-phosphatidyltransferase n=1 Tax=Babesia bovis TaxID=5865 RepID=S6B7F0_BABBO|nr:phosphatidylinositol synthase, putative [Babesia bovis]
MARNPRYLTKANGVTMIRTILIMIGMFFARRNPFVFVSLYTASHLLDMLDGYVSRYYNESTLVGAAFDQLLDRMSSTYLCFLNARQYPRCLEVFYLIMLIDICGHWIHNYACALYSNTNHKDVKDANIFLRVYYHKRWLMFMSIVMYETFFCTLYIRSMYHPGDYIYGLVNYFLLVSSPLCGYKILTNILQGIYGCHRIMHYDISTSK